MTMQAISEGGAPAMVSIPVRKRVTPGIKHDPFKSGAVDRGVKKARKLTIEQASDLLWEGVFAVRHHMALENMPCEQRKVFARAFHALGEFYGV